MKFSFQAFLFIIYLVGAYINYKLVLTESIFIPYFISYFAAVPLFFIHIKKILIRKYLFFLIGILFISILTIIFSPKLESGVLGDQLLSFSQLFLSLLSFLGVLFTLNQLHIEKVTRILFVFLCIILFGAFLERIFPFIGTISDLFRNTVYDSGIYDSDKRDLSMVGFIRPKFLSREPSFVSHFIVLLTLFWYLISRSKFKFPIALFIIFIGILVTGSPKIIILIPVILISYIQNFIKLIKRYHIFLISIFGIICLLLVFIVYFVFNERILLAQAGEDPSFNLRFIIPLAVIFMSLSKSPFFGVGLGGKENSISIFNDIIANFNLTHDFEHHFHNFTLEALHYYGILGTFMLIYIFNKYLLNEFTRINKFKFWIILILVSLMGSPFVGTRAWMTIALLIYCINISNFRDSKYNLSSK